MKRLPCSGERTGTFCRCGAAIVGYEEAPDRLGAPLDALAWGWFFICERGHIQQPATQLVLWEKP